MQQKQKIEESQKARMEQEERIKNAKEKNDSELQRKRKVIYIIFTSVKFISFYIKQRNMNQNKRRQRKREKYMKRNRLGKKKKMQSNRF